MTLPPTSVSIVSSSNIEVIQTVDGQRLVVRFNRHDKPRITRFLRPVLWP